MHAFQIFNFAHENYNFFRATSFIFSFFWPVLTIFFSHVRWFCNVFSKLVDPKKFGHDDVITTSPDVIVPYYGPRGKHIFQFSKSYSEGVKWVTADRVIWGGREGERLPMD